MSILTDRARCEKNICRRTDLHFSAAFVASTEPFDFAQNKPRATEAYQPRAFMLSAVEALNLPD